MADAGDWLVGQDKKASKLDFWGGRWCANRLYHLPYSGMQFFDTYKLRY